jgi:hypothetical protein
MPQVVAAGTARPARSAMACISSSNDVVAISNPASSVIAAWVRS